MGDTLTPPTAHSTTGGWWRRYGSLDSRRPTCPPALFLQRDRIVRIGVPPFRIEIATTISGVRFKDCYGRRVNDTVDDVAVSIIGLPDLKINKKACGRFKDLDDLEHLP
jgi:hypothetical protein